MTKKLDGLSAAQFKGIGKVAASWSMLEFQLQVKIWLILNVQSRIGMILTAEMQSSQLLTLLNFLVKYLMRNDPKYPQFRALYERMDALRIDRNKAVHFINARTPKRGYLAIKLKRTPEMERHKQFTARQLQEMTDKIKAATEELRKMEPPLAKPVSQKLWHDFSRRFGWSSRSAASKR